MANKQQNMSSNTKFHCDRSQDLEKVGLCLFEACLEGIMRHNKWSIDDFFNFNAIRELITSIPPIMVKSHETSKLSMKICF